MKENHDPFRPGERFPAGMDIPQRPDILGALMEYGVQGAEDIRLIDSTHDAQDIRLNYIVDKKWVLRFCNAPDMTEKRLGDLHRLIGRYRASGVACPRFLPDARGRFLHEWNRLVCYLSEYVDLPLAGDQTVSDEDRLIREVQESVARFAEKYRDVDLSETMGMYSLFDLSPFDIPVGIDEKEDNFNQLIALLREEDEDELAGRLVARHAEIRAKLKAVYRELPRCVFQGDENFSNILIDENEHFVGFIDFNMAGTEVIVNQLANLAGFDYNEKRTEAIGAENRLEYALDYFKGHMAPMLDLYHASEREIQALGWYAWIVMLVQWPTLCYFRDCVHGALKDEILELLSLIAEIPGDRLLPA